MIRKVIFCDHHREYPLLLERYLRGRGAGIGLVIEPDLERAYEMNRENPMCRLVVSDKLFEAGGHEMKKKLRETGRFAFITEDRTLPRTAERIYRFCPAEETVTFLNSLFEGEEDRPAEAIGIFSPSGGAACEFCAELAAEILGEKDRTSAVSFYPFSVFAGREGVSDLSALLYRHAAGEQELFGPEEPAGKIYAASNPEDIWKAEKGELAGVLEDICRSEGAAFAAAAIPPGRDALDLLSACGRILLIREGTGGACRLFSDHLTACGREEILKRVTALTLPPLPASSDPAEWEGMFRHGPFYAQVREAVNLLGLK